MLSAGKLRITLSGAGEPVIRDGLFCLLSKNFHNAPDLLNCLDKSFNVAARVIKIKTCPARRIKSQKFHQRLCAMMTCTNRNALRVKNRRNVVRVNVFNIERYDSDFVRRVATVKINVRQSF